jgi:hypothetical protein
MAGCSPWRPSDGEELGGGGRRRQRGQLVAGSEVEDEDGRWTAVDSDPCGRRRRLPTSPAINSGCNRMLHVEEETVD